MQSDIDIKIENLVTQYALAEQEATIAAERAKELKAHADRLYRRIEYWLRRQRQQKSGRTVKIKPARKRNPQTT